MLIANTYSSVLEEEAGRTLEYIVNHRLFLIMKCGDKMVSCYGKSGKGYVIDKQIGTGGEGKVYSLYNSPGIVAKTFTPETLRDNATRLEQKISHMLNMGDIYEVNGVARLSWPIDILYRDGMFVGYIMPYIYSEFMIYDLWRNGIKRNKLYPNYNWKYGAYYAYHLSWLVYYLHNHDIVIGDMNPKNIVIDAKHATVSFLDCASFDITDKQTGMHYPCTVGFREMLAPELLSVALIDSKKYSEPQFSKESDYFSLAIHIFRLLMDAADPFGGIYEKKYDSAGSHSDVYAIINGECPYVRNIPGKRIPSWSKTIDTLPPEIEELFRKTFCYTASTMEKTINSRATAKEWLIALSHLFS